MTTAASLQSEITRLEDEMSKAKEKLANLRREAAKEPIEDVELSTTQGKIKLSELFAGKSELILIHNMGQQCRWCTMWADGFNGVLPHLEDRAAFVVMSADEPSKQATFAAERNWKFKMVSSAGTSFAEKLGFEKNGERRPGVSVLTKDTNGKIHRHAHTGFGPGDNFCIVYDLFNLLPKPVGDWEPQYRYQGSKVGSSCCQH